VTLVARPNTLARDVQLAVAAFVVGLLLLALGGFLLIPTPGADVDRAWAIAPLVVLCGALGLRRVAPLTSLGLGVLGLAADVALGGTIANVLIFTQVLYEACVHGPAWLWRWALGVSVALTALAATVAMIIFGSWRGAAAGIPFALVFVLTTVTAISVRQYRDQAAAERTRAEQTARLADFDRAQAVAAERNRMARELHDVIANHLSAIAIHATALLSRRDMPADRTAEAVRVIRENSVLGLAEMRAMVELLREPGGPAVDGTTRPRLADARVLAEQLRATGLAVTLGVRGPQRALPVSVDLAAYRILQESLTNALKHGGGSTDVDIWYDDGVVRLDVRSELRSGDPAVPGSGAGIIGMRERAELLGGHLSAGPEGGSWWVRVELPTDGPA